MGLSFCIGFYEDGYINCIWRGPHPPIVELNARTGHTMMLVPEELYDVINITRLHNHDNSGLRWGYLKEGYLVDTNTGRIRSMNDDFFTVQGI